MRKVCLIKYYDLVFFENLFKTVGSILCAIITYFINTPNAYLVQFTGCGCVCIVGKIYLCTNCLWFVEIQIILVLY